MTCAHAVRVAIRKLPEVQKVDVGLKRGIATIDLKPGNNLRLSKLLLIIKDNGFVTRGIEFNARAKAGQTIVIAGTGEELKLAPGQSPPSGEFLPILCRVSDTAFDIGALEIGVLE